MRNRIRRVSPALAIVLAAAVPLTACKEAEAPPAVPKLVRTLKVSPGGTAADSRTYSGEVRARIETTLGFRIGGKLVERRVDVGTTVKAGQVLARIDGADTALQVAQAEAQRALAAADLSRYRDLRAKNFISASALDAKETAFKAAEAQAGLAKNQAAYTALVADRPGVIGQVLAEPGQVVGAGQAVLRMAPDGEREIAIAVPESELAALRLGQEAEVVLWANAAKIAGRLREIAPAADPVTRTYAVRVALKDADPRLPLGMSATVRFAAAVGEAARIVVPLAAVYQKDKQPAVWQVGADGSVSLLPVTVGAYRDDGAVISSGLTGGEQIVAAGVNRLAAGEKVRIATVKDDAR